MPLNKKRETTQAKRRRLKALAHALKPVVMVGNAGVSPAVLAELDRALERHELVKLRLAQGDRSERQAMAETVCAQSGAELISQIGRVVVVYRENPDD